MFGKEPDHTACTNEMSNFQHTSFCLDSLELVVKITSKMIKICIVVKLIDSRQLP